MVVEANLRFGKIEVERTGFETASTNALGQLMGGMEHALDRITGRFALQNLENFGVAEPAFGMDHGRVELRAKDLAIVGKQELDAFRQAVDIRLKRAKFVAQGLRQHGNDAVDQID